MDYALPDHEWQDMVDRYLWVPGYGMNAKMRSGLPTGDCLKFKRLKARWNQLQLWHEDPEDIHEFPLQWSDLGWLAKELHIVLPDKPRETVSYDDALEIFKDATPPVQVIEVHKHRLARIWRKGDLKVLIEIAELSHPEVIQSLCVESTLELTKWSGPDRMTAARDSVRRAVEELGLESESLKSMNYVDALTVWADGHRVGESP